MFPDLLNTGGQVFRFTCPFFLNNFVSSISTGIAIKETTISCEGVVVFLWKIIKNAKIFTSANLLKPEKIL